MIPRRTGSIPKEDVFPRLLYSDSTCSQVLPGSPEGHYISSVNSGRGMYATRVATRHRGDGKRLIFRQTVQGSVRAVRAVWNTRVFLTGTRVVADEHTLSTAYTQYSIHQVQCPPGTMLNECNINQVQHPPSTVSTQYCIDHVEHRSSMVSSKSCIKQVQHPQCSASNW